MVCRGRNSAALLAELPRYLDQTRPDVVLILVGFNDTWNFDRAGDDALDDRGWLRDLRVARLARLIRLNLSEPSAGPPRVVERDGVMMVVEDGVERPAGVGRDATDVVSGDRLVAQVRPNLTRMVELARERGVIPVLLTYATEQQVYFRDLNRGARDVATALDVPLIAIDEPFSAAIAEHGYDALFFNDDHPNASGNERIARIVAARLRELRLVPDVEPRDTAASGKTSATLEIDGDTLRFRVTADPHRDVQVVVSPRRKAEADGEPAGLDAHPMMARCLESPNLRGRTDGAGRADIAIDRGFFGPDGTSTLYAVAVQFALDGRATPSDVVEIPPSPR